MTSIDAGKQAVGDQIAHRINDGDCIGVGTGSTVDPAIRAIAERVQREKLRITCVTTSFASAQLCSSLGLQVLSSQSAPAIRLGFDGADEVDPHNVAIKGHGGALLQEKMLAIQAEHFIIIVDHTKKVTALGQHFALPVEVVPSATKHVMACMRELGASEVQLRTVAKGFYGPIFTEAGNLLLDVRFPRLTVAIGNQIKSITGVVEHGLFSAEVDEVLIGYSDGRVEKQMP